MTVERCIYLLEFGTLERYEVEKETPKLLFVRGRYNYTRRIPKDSHMLYESEVEGLKELLSRARKSVESGQRRVEELEARLIGVLENT